MDANIPDPLQIELYLVNDMLDSIVETMDDIERKSHSQSLSQDMYQKQNLFLQPGRSHESQYDQYLPLAYKRDAHNYFQNVSKLLNNPRLHTVQTSNIRMIKCHLCQKSVNSESALDHYSLHTKRKDVHKKTSKLSITPIPSANATTRGEQPKQVKTKSPRVCRYCFRKFADEDSFLRHVRKHSGIASGLFHCTKCYKTFNRIEDYRIHACDSSGLIQHLIKQGSPIDFQDKIVTQITSSTQRGDTTIGNDGSKMEVICWLCHLEFGTQSELYQHIHLVHEQFKYMLHACSICETFSKNKQTLRKHFQDEHGKESYCEECRQCFDTERDYQVHLAQRGYCGICNDHILNKCLEYQHIPTHLI